MRPTTAAPFAALLALVLAAPAAGQGAGSGLEDAIKRLAPRIAGMATVDFGDDAGAYTNDGECDDRRFFGPGMATGLGWKEAGHDATDCRRLHDEGRVRLWIFEEARAATTCPAIDFGSDEGEYASDGECDDLRFEGMGMAAGLGTDNVGKDATDCQRLCGWGMIFLRDY
ncbi:MAG: hypothetical protein IT545_07240 [Rhodobacteraceae bacterium]|nr:hypothetical protein [Paracoccaceae bacterium]